MEFSQFCACGPSGYAALKQKVDACAGWLDNIMVL